MAPLPSSSSSLSLQRDNNNPLINDNDSNDDDNNDSDTAADKKQKDDTPGARQVRRQRRQGSFGRGGFGSSSISSSSPRSPRSPGSTKERIKFYESLRAKKRRTTATVVVAVAMAPGDLSPQKVGVTPLGVSMNYNGGGVGGGGDRSGGRVPRGGEAEAGAGAETSSSPPQVLRGSYRMKIKKRRGGLSPDLWLPDHLLEPATHPAITTTTATTTSSTENNLQQSMEDSQQQNEKSRGRKSKYATEEERKEARRIQGRESYARRKSAAMVREETFGDSIVVRQGGYSGGEEEGEEEEEEENEEEDQEMAATDTVAEPTRIKREDKGDDDEFVAAESESGSEQEEDYEEWRPRHFSDENGMGIRDESPEPTPEIRKPSRKRRKSGDPEKQAYYPSSGDDSDQEEQHIAARKVFGNPSASSSLRLPSSSLSRLQKRKQVPQSPPAVISRFIEGSMKARASTIPPRNIIGPISSPAQSPVADGRATRNNNKMCSTTTPSASSSEEQYSSSSDRSNSNRASMFAFGALGSVFTFNPLKIVNNIRTSWEKQKMEYEERERERRTLKERKKRAELAYAEMKKKNGGYFPATAGNISLPDMALNGGGHGGAGGGSKRKRTGEFQGMQSAMDILMHDADDEYYENDGTIGRALSTNTKHTLVNGDVVAINGSARKRRRSEVPAVSRDEIQRYSGYGNIQNHNQGNDSGSESSGGTPDVPAEEAAQTEKPMEKSASPVLGRITVERHEARGSISTTNTAEFEKKREGGRMGDVRTLVKKQSRVLLDTFTGGKDRDTTAAEGKKGTKKEAPTKRELKRQERLLKKVSNLEEQLEKARKELEASLASKAKLAKISDEEDTYLPDASAAVTPTEQPAVALGDELAATGDTKSQRITSPSNRRSFLELNTFSVITPKTATLITDDNEGEEQEEEEEEDDEDEDDDEDTGLDEGFSMIPLSPVLSSTSFGAAKDSSTTTSSSIAGLRAPPKRILRGHSAYPSTNTIASSLAAGGGGGGGNRYTPALARRVSSSVGPTGATSALRVEKAGRGKKVRSTAAFGASANSPPPPRGDDGSWGMMMPPPPPLPVPAVKGFLYE